MSTTFEVFTLFPEAIEHFVSAGLLGKAIDRGLVRVCCTSYREFATDKHRTVDDTPFGGGAGMVLKPEPVVLALEHVVATRGPMHRVLLTPSAPVFDHAAAVRLAALPRIGLFCGRYEGIDDRVREHFVDECLSLGDFVLGGGEVAALAIIEAVSRMVEGVLGNPDSTVHESFAPGAHGRFLEHPQYTRPAIFRGHAVPSVLLGGDHEAIARWRRDASRRRTWALRPDLRHEAAPARPSTAVQSIYLVVDADMQPLQDVVAVARRHRVDGIIVHDAGPETLHAWVAAAGGRPPVAALADVATIRRRLRRAAAKPAPLAGPRPEPYLVGLVGPAARASAHAGPDLPSGPTIVDSAAELADAMAGSTQRPLALWLGAAPEGACDALWRTTPPTAAEAHRAPGDRGDGLALASTIVDVSQPAPPAAALADLALHRLRAPDRDGKADTERTPS
jgi:tRNA (guanine-N1)-methyltransferase